MIEGNITLGVIGGLGPMATAYFLELLIKMADVSIEQHHLNSIVYNTPYIPDRTSYITGKSKENPLPKIINIAKSLANQGADFLAIPCITAHYFHKEIINEVKIPILNVIHETVSYLRCANIKKVGIMATDGTICTGLFQEKLQESGIEWIIPEEKYQKKLMKLIYEDVKANNQIEINKFKDIEKNLKDNGAEVIILGCTELSLIKKEYKIIGSYLDALEVLATRSLQMAKIPVKKQYINLLV